VNSKRSSEWQKKSVEMSTAVEVQVLPFLVVVHEVEEENCFLAGRDKKEHKVWYCI
jgi:hypothetical protein